jgi:hypothetical protein
VPLLFAVGVTEVAARKILGLDPEKKEDISNTPI